MNDADHQEHHGEATSPKLRGDPSSSSTLGKAAAPIARLSHPQSKPTQVYPMTPTAEAEPYSGNATASASENDAAKNVKTSASLNVPCRGSMTSEQVVAASGGIFGVKPTIFSHSSDWPTEQFLYWIEKRAQPDLKCWVALAPSSQQLGGEDREASPVGGVHDVANMLMKMNEGKDDNNIDIQFTKILDPAEQGGWVGALERGAPRGNQTQEIRLLTVCECSDNVPEDFGTAGQYFSMLYAKLDEKIMGGLRKILTGKIRHELESLEKKWPTQELYQLVTGSLAIKVIVLNNQIHTADMHKGKHFKLEQLE